MKIPDRLYENPRLKAQQERQKQMRIEAQQKASAYVRKKLHNEVELKALGKCLLCIIYIADNHLMELQDTRKRIEPARDEEWSEQFCQLIVYISRLKRVLCDLWFLYLNIDRPQFYSYL